MKLKFSRLLAAGVAALLGASLAVAVSPGTAQASGTPLSVTFVSGTFRTPTGGAADCPGVPAGTDCQIDKFFGDIGGPDDGVNQGADDWLLTNYIHENVPTQGFWQYQDEERITDTRGIFYGNEWGMIDARPNLTTTGDFTAFYDGTTANGCYRLNFVISGTIDISSMVGQGANPVNNDSGTWNGVITQYC